MVKRGSHSLLSTGQNIRDNNTVVRLEEDRHDDNIGDTQAMARLEREKHGTLEDEDNYAASMDLHRHFKGCHQNPTHKNCIPVDQFNVNHLPVGFNTNDIMDLVHALSYLTVRMAVEYVSERRPNNVPVSAKPYPCYSNRGSRIMRVRTGWISEVRRFLNMDASDKTCDCDECLNSPTPKTQFAHIIIHTDAHVVCDALEGSHTTCNLFYDRGGTTDVCSSVVTLSGLSNVWSDVGTNQCLMKHATHDLELVDRLDEMVGHYHEILQRINDTYACNIFDMVCQPPPTTRHSLTIIVSHPHGCSKHVSVSHWTQVNKNVDSFQNTNTCPGSGGAPMLVIENKKLPKSMNRHSQNEEENRSKRVKKALLTIGAIMCCINVILTTCRIIAGGDIQQEVLEYKDTLPRICIECVELNKNCATEYDQLFSALDKRWEDGIEKCCAVTPEEVTTILEIIAKECHIKSRKGEISFTFTPVSAHKQLYAPVSEDKLTEPVFKDTHTVTLLFSIDDDPDLEHARGVKVTRDSLIIQYPGLYYVYSSVHFKPVSDRPAGEFQYQSWYHYVHRNSTTKPSNSGRLLLTVHSACDNCTKNEETAFTGGHFYMEVGDEIQVCVPGCGLVQFSKESTFVGLIMVNNGFTEKHSN